VIWDLRFGNDRSDGIGHEAESRKHGAWGRGHRGEDGRRKLEGSLKKRTSNDEWEKGKKQK